MVEEERDRRTCCWEGRLEGAAAGRRRVVVDGAGVAAVVAEEQESEPCSFVRSSGASFEGALLGLEESTFVRSMLLLLLLLLEAARFWVSSLSVPSSSSQLERWSEPVRLERSETNEVSARRSSSPEPMLLHDRSRC